LSFPRLDYYADPAGATGLVVVAHGGRQRSRQPTPDWAHALTRMFSFVDVAVRADPAAAVGLVRYRHRGWNEHGDALTDLLAVLDAVAEGDIRRVVLVGHSMGGRAVIGAADHPLVVGVAALAPWLTASDAVPDLSGRLVVVAHGDRDRITSAAMTQRYVERARAAGNALAMFSVAGDGHAMLRRGSDWDELVRRTIISSLSGDVDPALAAAASAVPGDGSEPLPTWRSGNSPVATVLRLANSRRRLERQAIMSLG